VSIDVERRDGAAIVTVNRPDALNALDLGHAEALQARLAELALDAEARAVVLTGAGEKAFIAGADIKYMQVALAGKPAPRHYLAFRVERQVTPRVRRECEAGHGSGHSLSEAAPALANGRFLSPVRPRSSGWQPQSVSATRALPTARLWTAAQAAAYLGVRPSWLYEATREGRVPVVKLGKHLRFLQDDLDVWIAEHRIEARP
jgi:excisionase family DNA binding protein